MKRLIVLIIVSMLAFPLSTSAAEQAVLRQLELGRQLYQTGKTNQALSVLRNLIRQDNSSREAVQSFTLIARIFIEQHNYNDALLYLKQIPEELVNPETELLRGLCLIQTDQPAAGILKLRPLLQEPLSVADRNTLFQTLSAGASATQNYLEALYYLNQQATITSQPASIAAQMHDLMQNQLTQNQLEEAAFMWQGTALGQDALLQLARRALVQQQPDLAKRYLERIFASSVTFPYWQEAQNLLARTGEDNWLSRDSIGVMLPLSGRYASYAQLVKNGLDLALQEHNKTRLPIRFIYQDTATEGVTPAQLVSSLCDDDKVMAIIGPLLGSNAEAAARRAQQEMVPMLTLAQGDALPELGHFIFRDTLTSEQQIKTLVSYAMAKGNVSFSILHPQNRLGEQMANLFRNEVINAGGEIVDIVNYSEDSTDFKKPIAQLLWRNGERPIPRPPLEEGKGQPEPLEAEYPQPPFHALFIPDFADHISLIAPQLMFYGIKDTTLLGINGWNSPDLAERAGRFLKDAVFVDAFFSGANTPEVKRFNELYQQTYAEEPSILEAQAFEAASILLRSIDDPAVINREELRQKLMNMTDFHGITGTVGFDAFGEAQKELYLLGFKGNRIIEINQ